MTTMDPQRAPAPLHHTLKYRGLVVEEREAWAVYNHRESRGIAAFEDLERVGRALERRYSWNAIERN
jgi:hypothetical protein